MMASEKRRAIVIAVAIVALLAVFLNFGPGRNLADRFFSSLRLQKVHAVNVDLSAFTDPNANPALHQMVAQMISDKVNVTASEEDQPAATPEDASKAAGFPVRLLNSRKDPPKLVVSGHHAVTMTVDRARLQEIVKEAGHPELTL